MQQKTRDQIDTEIIDFSFYLIQRGEAGHKNGCHEKEYKCSAGKRTIGYGTVTEKGYNYLNYTDKTITEPMAVLLAKREMYFNLYAKCRAVFPNFDEMLPCYQALIVDRFYQGMPDEFIDLINKGPSGREELKRYVADNKNKERAAVRARTVEMGIMIRDAYRKDKGANPEKLARTLAEKMIQNHKSKNGTDQELTRDELGLLYRSCMAMYHKEVTKAQVDRFARSFEGVATGTHGIGFNDYVFKEVEYTVADGVDENGNPKTKTIKLRKKQGKIYRSLTETRADFRITERNAMLGAAHVQEPTAQNNYNNPDPKTFIKNKRPRRFQSLADGYRHMAKHIRQKGNHRTCYEILRDYVGVKNVRGSHLLERMRQKGYDIDKDTKLDLDNPEILGAVTLSIAEFRTNGNVTGGKQMSMYALALAVHPKREEFIAMAKHSEALFAQVTQTAKPKKDVRLAKTPQPETPQTQPLASKKKTIAYQETAPSSKNEFNNPARICRKGKPISYQTLDAGYGALTEMLHKNYNGLTCQELIERFTGLKSKDMGNRLRRYLVVQHVQVSNDTKLDLNDPNTLKAVAIAMTQMRQQGKILGGQEYAALCIQKKVSALLPANDGVAVHVQQPQHQPQANVRLAQVSRTPSEHDMPIRTNTSRSI